MTGRRYIPLVLAALCLGSCTDHGEDRAIERVLNGARDAVLAADGTRACRLLTPQGRERALALGPSLERPPHSCPDVLRQRLVQARRDPDSHWRGDLKDAILEVLSANDERAQAELRVEDPFGPALRWRIRLRKTSAGWRVDDSNVVPSGG